MDLLNQFGPWTVVIVGVVAVVWILFPFLVLSQYLILGRLGKIAKQLDRLNERP